GYGFLNWVPAAVAKVAGARGELRDAGGYGAQLKQDYRRFYGASIGMAGRGTAMARKDNYCEIDPTRLDKYGIPVLRFHYKWENEEKEQAKHIHDTFKSIMHEMEEVVLSGELGIETKYGLEATGVIIHEGRPTRIGNQPW